MPVPIVSSRSAARPSRWIAGIALTACVAGWSAWTTWGPRAASAQDAPDADADPAVFLPTDRLKERQLELARRLIKDARWSDAATLLDEILSADRDFFFKPDINQGTWRSVKVEAGRLVQALPPPGAEAYALQFRARADRALREAVLAGERHAIVAVARRWFQTPAGQKATMLAAIEALDADQPLAAAAWLDRLAAAKSAEWEPTLSVMRAIAWLRAGDQSVAVAILESARGQGAATARIGGRDIAISFPPGGAAAWLESVAGASTAARRTASEWTMHRGEPSRNGLVTAARPLLAPRYRVPLARHPQEARWLEARRKLAADQEAPLLPAGVPLAVDGTLLVHGPMGLLAIDFVTGKRLWMKTGGAAGPVLDAPLAAEDRGDGSAGEARDRRLAPVFDDATSGTLASDGRLVFAVESDPDALVARDPFGNRLNVFGRDPAAGGWSGGNSLVAYDLADRGAVAWRLPAPAADAKAGTGPWYLGPPLPVSGQLFVLVEEAGEVRLDVIEARSGRLVWSQPLAELDEDTKVDNLDSRGRRVAGLSPALAEGVLVCPTGAGAVIAVDLATRTLLWAYNFATTPTDDVMILPNGVRVQRPGGIGGRIVVNGVAVDSAALRQVSGRWIDNVPIVVGGRVLLAPGESAELHCIDLRSGAVVWKRPRDEARFLAGVVGSRILLVGRSEVEAVALETGRSEWKASVAPAGRAVSGRGMLTGDRLFVPVDTPEVVEIDVATGAVRGRSPGRGGAIPGNLVAYRGEVISQGADSLDVFHQTAPLEARIETAARAQGGDEIDAWAMMWRGQLQLDAGDVAGGMRSLKGAATKAPERVPPEMLADAMVFAMERDATAAASIWRDAVALGSAPLFTARALRAAVDGLVAAGDLPQAWEALRSLLAVQDDAGTVGVAAPLIDDAADSRVAISAGRWIRGRLARLIAAAPADLRTAIDADAADRVEASSSADTGRAEARLAAVADWFAGRPAAVAATRELIGRLADRADDRGGDAAREGILRRDRAILDLLHSKDAAARDHAASLLDAERRRLGTEVSEDLGAAWPLGRVTIERVGSDHAGEAMGLRGPRVVPLAVMTDERSLFPGLRLEFDVHQPGLHVSDGCGRRLGGPLPVDDTAGVQFMLVGGQMEASREAGLVGRVLVIRSGGVTTAYELSAGRSNAKGEGRHRRLWTSVADAVAAQPHGSARGINRWFPRQGNVELGMRIAEAEPAGIGAASFAGPGLLLRGGAAAMLAGRTLQVRDPVSGAVLWERHRLPEDAALFGDDDVLCVWPRGVDRATLVLSAADGRVVRECVLPGLDRVLLTHGRFVVVIEPEGGEAAAHAEAVRLVAVDPAGGDRVDLGRYSGRARAATAGPGGLAVLEPGGRLTVIDLDARRVAFTTVLPDMPDSFERVTVTPWQDRFLVMVGRPETPADTRQATRLGVVTPLLAAHGSSRLFTGAVWAVDRTSGDPLWQVPATVLMHGLMPQPSDLPVLVFARRITPPRPGERSRLSLLCLDKRTGHAAFVDDRMVLRQDTLFGCDVAGDPAAHTVTISPVGGGLPGVVLRFTGEPIAPQVPFQAAEQPAVSGDFAAELEYWFNRVITWPTPF